MKAFLIASLLLFAFTMRAQNVTVDFNKVIVKDFAGFGTQYNANLYTNYSSPDGITAANVGQLEAKVKALKSQYVRIFFDSRSWKSDPGYLPDNADFGDSFVKTVKLAQDAGASIINITYWHSSTAPEMPDFAKVLYDLIVNHKLNAVKEVTIQNEPNTTKMTLDTYKSCYVALDKALKDLGIRNKIRFVGGDLVSTDQQNWFSFMAENMSSMLFGYSSHIYWDDNDTLKPVNRLKGVAEIVNSFSGAAKKPVYLTEYGVRGSVKPANDPMKDPGYLTGTKIPISRTTVSAIENALFQINAMNLGFAGFIRWDCYKAKYGGGEQFYSCIGSGTDGYPLYPLYYMTYLFTHTCESGWEIVKTSSAVDVHNTFAVSALKDGSGKKQTVYAINTAQKSTPYSLSGLAPNQKYNVYSFNTDGNGKLKKETSLKADAAGVVKGIAMANSLIAVTTSDIKLP